MRVIANGLPGDEFDHAAVVAEDAVEEVLQLADEDQVAEAGRLQVRPYPAQRAESILSSAAGGGAREACAGQREEAERRVLEAE